jgi:hypothetical protein
MSIGESTRGGNVRSSIPSAGLTIIATLTLASSWLLLAAARAPVPGDACSLLSKEDAAAALGEAATGPKAIGPMTDGSGATVSGCEYTGSGYHRVQLNVTRPTASALPMYKGIICNKKTKDGLAGLGEIACWYNEKHEELHAIKGGAFLSVELNRSGNPTEPIIAVMKKALAKLK